MNVLLFGATGMVGQGVLRECLLDPDVQVVQTVGRTATGVQHAKHMFRPGFIQPVHGVRSKTTLYSVFYALSKPLNPLLRFALPNFILTTEEIGRAMLAVAKRGAPKRILESRDIRAVLLP
jgi:hypothetical protein